MNVFHAISKKIPEEGMELVNFYRFLTLGEHSCWQCVTKNLGSIVNVQNLGHNLYMVETNNCNIYYVWQVVKRFPKECLEK